MRILVIDDNAEFRTIVSDYIRRQANGWEVFEAFTGEMAVSKAAQVKPDLIIMDINLPQMSGLEAIEAIRDASPWCEFIILTVFDIEPFRRKSRELGVLDFIEKTEVYDRLLPAIRKSLASRTADARRAA